MVSKMNIVAFAPFHDELVMAITRKNELLEIVNSMTDIIDYNPEVVDYIPDIRPILAVVKREKLIYNTIIKVLQTGVNEGLGITGLENRLFAHPICRKRPLACKKYISNITTYYKHYENVRKQKINEAKLISKFFDEHKYDFTILPIEECSQQENIIEEYIFEQIDNATKIIKKQRKFDTSNILIGPRMEHTKNVFRNIFLLKKIAYILKSFRENRQKKLINFNFYPMRVTYCTILDRATQQLEQYYNDIKVKYSIEEAEIQMDAEGEPVTPIVEKAGNVILTQGEGTSSDTTTIPKHKWSSYTSSDIVGCYSEMTNRWLRISKFTWTNNMGRDLEIANLILPQAVVLNNQWAMCHMPNTIPFKVHRYWRGDMEVKVQVNSNKFQIGQIQVAFYYEPDLDEKFSLRRNIYSTSQVPHAIISAGASNEGCLTVPFKFHQPMISTKRRHDFGQVLDIGRLFIRVLSPLRVPTAGPKECYGQIFVRFSNCEFTGQINGALDTPETAEHQMDTAIKIASNVLNNLKGDNMDNPPDVRSPMFVVPTASHSWAAGTNATEPIHSLRLDIKGQTGHPDKLPSESKIKHLTNIFGLVTVMSWHKNLQSGSQLLNSDNKYNSNFDAAPILEMDSYEKIQGTGSTATTYYVPPVGVIANLFNYWRGSIEFRFDIVSSQFHTGRLVVAYVPGATTNTNVTLETILAGPHVVFDLQSATQFSYVVPYVADKPYWQRRYQGNYKRDQVIAPSRIYIFVLNPLVVMESIADTVEVLMYMRAGPDFEVAIPVQPCFGLSYNTTILYKNSELVHALEGYYAYYPGWAKSTLDGKCEVFRYGTGTDQLSIFNTTYIKKNTEATGYYYRIADESAAPQYYDGADYKKCLYALGIWRDLSKKTEMIMLPYATENAVKLDLHAYCTNKNNAAVLKYYISSNKGTTGNRYGIGNPNWIPMIYAWAKIEEDFVIFNNEKESIDTRLDTSTNLKSAGEGFMLYGEKYNDLKDLGRRYQVYTSLPIQLEDIKQIGQCSYIVPLLPQGLDLNLGNSSKINEVPNRCRDGHIPIILSGFRYYRGSMRVRVVLPTTRDMLVWIQHRPDRKLRQRIPIKCVDLSTAEGLANHSYASYLQDTGVNSIVEFEVPFYQNSAYGLLQRPKILQTIEGFCTSMGELSIGFVTYSDSVKKPFVATLYNCIGDDFHMSTFQGFPPVMLLDSIVDIDPEYAEPQMGLLDKVRNSITKKVKDEVSTTVKTEGDKIVSQCQEHILKLKETISESDPTSLFNIPLFRCISSNIAHLIANFNLKSFAICVVSILLEIGLLVTSTMQKFIDAIVKFLEGMRKYCVIVDKSGEKLNRPDKASSSTEQETAIPNMDTGEDPKCAIGLITLLWTAVCSLFAFTIHPPTDLFNISRFLFRDLKGILTVSNLIYIFLRNITEAVEWIKRRVLGLVTPRYALLKKFDDASLHIKSWAHEVLYLCDPEVYEKERYTQEYRARVNVAYLTGGVLTREIPTDLDKSHAVYIMKVYEKITEFRARIVDTGEDSLVRKEPFVIWQYGEPGIGKSTISNHIACELLRHRNIKCNVSPVYNHNAASEFWDSCQNNPVMMVDDLFCVEEGDILTQHLQVLFTVVSPVILTPPKARLEDKGKPYNPEILFINSNKDTVRINNVNNEAIHRRRHVLVKTEKDDTVKVKDCPHCNFQLSIADTDAKYLADYHHLKFSIAQEVVPQNGGKIVYGKAMKYDEFMRFLKDKYTRVMDKNDEMYKRRVDQVMSVLNTRMENTQTASLNDTISFYKHKQKEICNKIMEESVCAYIKQLGPKISGLWDMMNLKCNILFANKHVENSTQQNVLCTVKHHNQEVSYSMLMDLVDKQNDLVDLGSIQILYPEMRLGHIFDLTKKDPSKKIGCQYAIKANEYEKLVTTHPWLLDNNMWDAVPLEVWRHKKYTTTDSNIFFMRTDMVKLIQKFLNNVNYISGEQILRIYGSCNSLGFSYNEVDSFVRSYVWLGWNCGPLDNIFYITLTKRIMYEMRDRSMSVLGLKSCFDVYTTLQQYCLDHVCAQTPFDFEGFKTIFSCGHWGVPIDEIKMDDDGYLYGDLEDNKKIYFDRGCAHRSEDSYNFCPINSIFLRMVLLKALVLLHPKWYENKEKSYSSIGTLTDPILSLGPDVLADESEIVEDVPIPLAFRDPDSIPCPSNFLANLKDKLSQLKSRLHDKFPKWFTFDTAMKVFKYIISASAFIVGVLGLSMAGYTWYTTGSVTPTDIPHMKQEMTRDIKSLWSKRSSEPQGHAYTNTGNNVILNKALPRAIIQSEIPQYDACLSRIKKNTFCITSNVNGKIMRAYGIVLFDRTLLLLRHYVEIFDALPPHTVFFGKFSNIDTKQYDGISFNYRDCDRSYFQNVTTKGEYASNLLLFYLPIKFQQCRDLTRFIATDKMHQLFSGEGCLVENNGVIHENLHIIHEEGRPMHIKDTQETSEIVLQHFYSYKYQGKGMCGSIIMGHNLERPIIGIHVAGVCKGNVRGIAEPLFYEQFCERDQEHADYSTFVLPELENDDICKMDFDTILFRHGAINESVHQNGDTNYVPSLIQGVYPVRTEPNPLKINDPRLPPNTSPLRAGIQHMGKPPLDFPKKDLIEARKDLQRIINQNVIPLRKKVGVVNLQDAICGNKDIEGFEPLEWSTSPGYPLRFEKTGKQTGKKWLFDLEETSDGYKLKGIHPKLSDIIKVDRALRRENIKPFTVFIDCLKDTCLPIEKCSIVGKTRVFSISPVQFTIEFKRYFLDFTAAYQKARFSAEHGIGIDVNSCEWTDLAGILTNKGGKIICGDYKNFGPGLMLEAAYQAFEIILDWYKLHGDEANNKIRKIMRSEILGAYHLASNTIYTAPCGIPSGSPITTPLNSLVNSIYIRIAWKYTTNLNYLEMQEYTNIITYGDDVCIGVADYVVDKFNTQTMHNFFSTFNIVFTDINKEGDIVPYRSLLDAQFLKCNFRQHPVRHGMWLAMLDKTSIEGCLNWINKKNNKVKATADNIEQAIMLSHGWGPDYYNEVIKNCEKAITHIKDLNFRYQSWDALDEERYGDKAMSLNIQYSDINCDGYLIPDLGQLPIHWTNLWCVNDVMPICKSEYKFTKYCKKYEEFLEYGEPQMLQQQYENYPDQLTNLTYHEFINYDQIRQIIPRLRRLNFSLQEQRTMGLQILENCDFVYLQFDRQSRFPQGKFLDSTILGINEIIMRLRMSLVFKNNTNENVGNRSSYNDAMAGFYNNIEELNHIINNYSNIITRQKFETENNLVWQ